MPGTDLRTATERTAALVAAVAEEQLRLPTPCPRYTVGDPVDHLATVAVAFTAAATEAPSSVAGDEVPLGDAANLPPDWRTAVPAALAALGEAWTDPSAWDGMTSTGPLEMPAEVAGLVALEEVVVHGWDLARATGRPYAVDDATLDVLLPLVADFAPVEDHDHPIVNDGTLPYAPAVPVPDGAPLLDRVVALTGRDRA